MGRHFEHGQTLFGLRRYQEAVKAFTAELADQPDSAIAFAMRAAAYVNMRKFRNAKEDTAESLRRNPNLAYAHYILSFVRAAYGRFNAAEASVNEALRLESHSDYFARLAEIHFFQSRFSDSLQAAERSLELDARNITAQLVRAKALGSLGRQDEAETCLQALLSQNPEAPEPHHALGSLTLEVGTVANAVEMLREARRLSPLIHNDRNALGAAYGRLFGPLRFIDRLIIRPHNWTRARRWTFLASFTTVLLGVSYFFAATPIVSVPIFLVALNALAAAITFKTFATAIGKFVYRHDLDISWYWLLPEATRVVFPLALHILISVVSVVCALNAGFAIFVLGFIPNLELILLISRKASFLQSFGIGILAALGIAIPITIGSASLIDSDSSLAGLACWCFALIHSYVLTLRVN